MQIKAPFRHKPVAFFGRGEREANDGQRPLEERVNNSLRRFKETHGDTYDYSLVDYHHQHAKVTIICRKHGEFSQTPSHHIAGGGCSACARENGRYAGNGKSTEQHINGFIDVHGDRYDYSLIEGDITSTCKVPIVCSEHGTFHQQVFTHKAGANCPECAKVRTGGNKKNVPTSKESKMNDVFNMFMKRPSFQN